MRGEKATATEEKVAVDAKDTTKSNDTKAAKTTPAKAAKSTEVKETAAKKTAKTQKKTVKEQVKPDIFIQFQGKETMLEDALEQARQQYIAAGHRVSSIKSLQVYLKPEESAAYYVINQKFAGKVDLF